jgi:hypothetical protein
MLGGADTSTPCVDQEPAAGVKLGGSFRGVNFTSRMPEILSLDFSCAQLSGATATALAAIAAAAARNSRRLLLIAPPPLSALTPILLVQAQGRWSSIERIRPIQGNAGQRTDIGASPCESATLIYALPSCKSAGPGVE